MKTVKIWFVGSNITEECQLTLQANQEDIEKSYKEETILTIDEFMINFKYVIKVEYESK